LSGFGEGSATGRSNGVGVRRDINMATWHRRLIRLLPGALVLLGVLSFFAWPLVNIQLRLSRNGAIAAQLVESLRDRFPDADFRGTASYEQEVIYITVVGGLNKSSRQDVEQWLRRQKTERKIAPAIWLKFSDDIHDQDITEI
jgi:hypothetical protein